MNGNEIANAVVRLLNITKNMQPIDYYKDKLPSSIDEEIMGICSQIMDSSPQKPPIFVSSLNTESCDMLMNFCRRMTMLSIRQNSSDYLLKGLVALSLVADRYDYREVLMEISLVYHSAEKLNVDPKQLFSVASNYSSSESIRKLIMGYLDRSLENQDIGKMGFKEVYGPSGLIYQLGNHPIPEGFL
jgi:hypothetical protein